MVLYKLDNKKKGFKSHQLLSYFSFESINCGFKSVFKFVLGDYSLCIYFSPRSADSIAAMAAIIAAM
jgi:hypothetical protein